MRKCQEPVLSVFLSMYSTLLTLPNYKILALTKLKAFADDKIIVIEIYLEKKKKHCGKRRNCWLPAFSPFPTMFSKTFLISRGVKSRNFAVMG